MAGETPAPGSRWDRLVRSPRAGALLVAAIALAASASTLRNGFVFDDIQNVLQNPWVADPSRVGEAFRTHLAGFDPRFRTSYYRPLFQVLLAATRAAAGLRPWAFHLVNVAMHVAVCVFVYLLALRFAGRGPGPDPDGRSGAGALVGAALFAVHPIHAESVAWISGITDLSCAFFAFPAILLATARRPSAASAWMAGALALAALLCKEPAVVVYAAVGAVLVARGDARDPAARRGVALLCAALGAALGLYLVLRVRALGGLMLRGAERVDPGAGEALFTGLALAGDYLRKLVVPTHLSALHDFRIVSSPLDLHVLAGAAGAAALAWIAWSFRRDAGVLLGVTMVIVPIVPALHLKALGEGLFADRYLYLSTAGAALLAAAGWNAAAARGPKLVRPLGAALALLGAGYAAATLERNAVWGDDLSLWTDAVEKSPGSAAAHAYLGYALLSAGRVEDSVAELRRALAIDASNADARMNLASSLAALGRADEALAEARRVASERPSNAEAHAVLGYALAAGSDHVAAAAEYERALALNPAMARVQDALGRTYYRLGMREASIARFREAVRLEPGNPGYARDLAIVEAR